METGVSDRSTAAAERELEASIQRLNEVIARVSEEERSALSSLQRPLSLLEESVQEENPQHFLRALVDLARAVIDIRYKAERGPLAELPVPPYDLWLPFKAEMRSYQGSASEPWHPLPVRSRKMLADLGVSLSLIGGHCPGTGQAPGLAGAGGPS